MMNFKHSMLDKIKHHTVLLQAKRFNGSPTWKYDRSRLRKLFGFVKDDPRKYTNFKDYSEIYNLAVMLRSKGHSDFVPMLKILTPGDFAIERNFALENEAYDAIRDYVDIFGQ